MHQDMDNKLTDGEPCGATPDQTNPCTQRPFSRTVSRFSLKSETGTITIFEWMSFSSLSRNSIV